MKKLLLFSWLMMLSIMAMAQTIVVVDKDGNKTAYDPSEVTSIDFQSTPPGFTVNWNDASRQYTFNEVQSVKGLPDYLFVDPKVVNVSFASTDSYEAIFAAEVKTNVEYEVETSDPWIKVARKEADRLVCNVLQHEGNDRRGYVALASKDGLLTDTIKVSIDDEFYVLKCLDPLQSITTVGTAQFTLIEIVNGASRPAAGKTISFSAENGTCSVKEAVTDAQGTVRVDFIPNSESIDRGSVQASFRGRSNGISMMYTSTALFAVEVFELRCMPKQYFWKDEAVTVEFQLMKYDKGTRKPVRATDINFTCENGTLNAQSKQTDEEGKVTVDFAPDKNFKTGTVTARCKIQLIGGGYWNGDATTEVIKGEEYMLEALTPDIYLSSDNFDETPVQFRLLKYDLDKDQWEPCGDKTIEFTAVNGVTESTSAVSDVDGIVTVTFQPDQGFVEGSVTANCKIQLIGGSFWYGEATTELKKKEEYMLEALTPDIYLSSDNLGEIPVQFRLLTYDLDKTQWEPCGDKTIEFTAVNGVAGSTSAVSDVDGIVTVTFQPDQGFVEGSLTASCDIDLSDGNKWHGEAVTKFVKEEQYKIERVQPEENEAEIAWDETKTVKFRVLKKEDSGYQPVHLANVYFDCVDGECSLDRVLTDEEGIASTLFTLETDKSEGSIKATYHILDDNGIWHYGSETASFIIPLYKLEATHAKVAVKNDGSKQQCYFNLYEYQNGNWEMCQKEVEINFEATGVTLSETSRMNGYGGTHASFTAGKDFKEGSITATCDIELEDGRVWHGDATAELILDNYQFSRVLPEDDITEIYPDESQDVVFSLSKQVNGTYQPCKGQVVAFNSQQGTFSSRVVNTNEAGEATTSFKINPDIKTASVFAHCSFTDEQDVYHSYDEKVEFVKNPYKLNTNHEKVAVKNDGSKQQCYFNLYEYQNGNWEMCQKEVEINFEATGVTLSETSRMNGYGGTHASFTAGKDFKEGSITAKCDIELAKDYVWHGVATAELILDDYQFSRVLPEDDITEIYPDESQESQDVVFSLSKLVNGTYQPCKGQVVDFNSQQGTFSSRIVNTNEEGKATTSFKINPDVKAASVFAHCSFTDEQDVYHSYDGKVEFVLIPYRLKCLTPEVEMTKSDGTATIRYELLEYKKGEWVACPDKMLVFAATNGSVEPYYALTNEKGICQTVFTPTEDATEGTVTGTCTIVVNEKTNFVWTQSQAAHITIIDNDPCDTGDELLNKANLMDNSYVIKNKTTGETKTRDYAPTWSEWRKDGKDFISFYLEDADENGMTQGDAWGHLPWNMVNVVKALTGQSFENSPGGKFGLGVYVKDCQLNANFAAFTGESGTGMATEGNLKPESKILIRKPCNTKKEASAKMRRAPGEEEEYTGEYELLFYLVFQNQTYNRETGQMEDGDEYEVYGKGTMKMHIPTITSMQLSSESQYLKVGESTKVKVDQYYEEGAQWDWSDVQIAGQSADYSSAYDGADEGFFTWDPATQTLTSVKPNDNKSVYVVFSLKSKPSVKSAFTIATGEGWKYTSFKVGPEEQEVSPGYGCSFYISSEFAPKDSEDEEFDDSAIEIDPESDPDGNFRYVHYNGRYSARLYVYRSDAAPGEYNIRFRLKSDHSVGCTMKITIKGKGEE